jgi:hypothetical protein
MIVKEGYNPEDPELMEAFACFAQENTTTALLLFNLMNAAMEPISKNETVPVDVMVKIYNSNELRELRLYLQQLEINITDAEVTNSTAVALWYLLRNSLNRKFNSQPQRLSPQPEY